MRKLLSHECKGENYYLMYGIQFITKYCSYIAHSDKMNIIPENLNHSYNSNTATPLHLCSDINITVLYNDNDDTHFVLNSLPTYAVCCEI